MLRLQTSWRQPYVHRPKHTLSPTNGQNHPFVTTGTRPKQNSCWTGIHSRRIPQNRSFHPMPCPTIGCRKCAGHYHHHGRNLSTIAGHRLFFSQPHGPHGHGGGLYGYHGKPNDHSMDVATECEQSFQVKLIHIIVLSSCDALLKGI